MSKRMYAPLVLILFSVVCGGCAHRVHFSEHSPYPNQGMLVDAPLIVVVPDGIEIAFEEMETSDVWPHKYAVMSDGVINIGLHDRVFDSPALSFVQPDLARHARSMADHGFDFTYLQLDDDVFNELGFKIRATEGTRAFLAASGVAAEPIKKLHEGRPNIVDAIMNAEVQLVINAPVGKLSQHDDSYIRKSAIKYKIPYITTPSAAAATVEGIAAYRTGTNEVKSLQSYHADID